MGGAGRGAEGWEGELTTCTQEQWVLLPPPHPHPYCSPKEATLGQTRSFSILGFNAFRIGYPHLKTVFHTKIWIRGPCGGKGRNLANTGLARAEMRATHSRPQSPRLLARAPPCLVPSLFPHLWVDGHKSAPCSQRLLGKGVPGFWLGEAGLIM